MTRDEVIGKLHRACTQIRLAIQRYEVPDLPADEEPVEHLTTAMQLCAEVREEIAK